MDFSFCFDFWETKNAISHGLGHFRARTELAKNQKELKRLRKWKYLFPSSGYLVQVK